MRTPCGASSRSRSDHSSDAPRCGFAAPAALLCAIGALAAATAAGQSPTHDVDQPRPISEFHQDHPWCLVTGSHATEGAVGPLPVSDMFDEIEPNDSIGDAQTLPVNPGERILLTGSIGQSGDLDHYSVPLQQGDVVQFYVRSLTLGLSIQLDLFDADQSSTVTARTSVLARPVFIVPQAPLIGAPNDDDQAEWDAALTWVVQETRDEIIRLSADSVFGGLNEGLYELNITRLRAPIESAPPGTKQVVYLQFDGAMIDQNDIYSPGSDPISPLADFIPLWGLDASDEDAVIDAIVDRVAVGIEALAPLNPLFDYDLRNSRDHADPFGDPFVTRVIIGGTRDELGINVIGIAQNIDVGNFAPELTAFVLLDILSGENSPASLNNVPRDPGFSMIDAIGRVVGNITLHELGHNIGGVHTENSNDVRSVMDAGGQNLIENLYGVGPDGILGTEDDEDVLFALDEYIGSSATSSITGLEPTDSVAAIAFGTPTGCAADLNGDEIVNGADLAILLAGWGTNDGPADFNGDGVVDGADLAAMLAVWGPCP